MFEVLAPWMWICSRDEVIEREMIGGIERGTSEIESMRMVILTIVVEELSNHSLL